MPSNAPKSPAPKSGIIGAAVALGMLLAAAFEGLVTHPNPDPGKPQIQQVCYGDTEVQMRTYTPAECKALLEARMRRDYAPAVLKCAPGIADRKEVFAASIDFAYNEGNAAFCRSSMARLFNAKQFRAGCERFLAYDGVIAAKPVRGAVSVKRLKNDAKGHPRYFSVLRGLQRRRVAERQLCLKGA